MPPMTRPMNAISSGSNKRVNQSTQRAILVVEIRNALGHLTHAAGMLADTQQAQRDRVVKP